MNHDWLEPFGGLHRRVARVDSSLLQSESGVIDALHELPELCAFENIEKLVVTLDV